MPWISEAVNQGKYSRLVNSRLICIGNSPLRVEPSLRGAQRRGNLPILPNDLDSSLLVVMRLLRCARNDGTTAAPGREEPIAPHKLNVSLLEGI